MNASEVADEFGSPDSKIEIEENSEMWVYSLPLDPQKEGASLGGFSLQIKDDKVTKWSPVVRESRQTFKAGGGAGGNLGEQSFAIFLATDDQAGIVSTLESNGSVDASGLKSKPELVFKSEVFAGSSGKERAGEQTVILVVSEQEALKLKDLTSSNLGKRLLIVCRNRVIAAPVISAPISSRQLMFTVKDSEVLNKIQGQ